MDIRALLTEVQAGRLSVDQAAEQLKHLPYEDLDFAKLDRHRGWRSGFGEAVYCAGKTAPQIIEIFRSLIATETAVLGTRISEEQAMALTTACPQADWNPAASTVCYQPRPPQPEGRIAVCTGGTSDQRVAEEAAATAAFFGAAVDRHEDVGVAGIQRLFDRLPQIHQANVVIAIAGMEGALGTVLAGLVDKPVICVPTSVGYGANFKGVTALLSMLNSCSEGLAVVNIDNGFGAGYLAAQINRLAVRGQTAPPEALVDSVV